MIGTTWTPPASNHFTLLQVVGRIRLTINCQHLFIMIVTMMVLTIMIMTLAHPPGHQPAWVVFYTRQSRPHWRVKVLSQIKPLSFSMDQQLSLFQLYHSVHLLPNFSMKPEPKWLIDSNEQCFFSYMCGLMMMAITWVKTPMIGLSVALTLLDKKETRHAKITTSMFVFCNQVKLV